MHRQSDPLYQAKHSLHHMLRCLEVCSRGIRARIRIEKARASTPPSLLGIDRKIAYANKKYHSGLM